VLQRVGELRRTGMWSSHRLPKVQETPRSKAQWDYVLDEMQWLAVDFAQERRWKMAAAKKVRCLICSKMQLLSAGICINFREKYPTGTNNLFNRTSLVSCYQKSHLFCLHNCGYHNVFYL